MLFTDVVLCYEHIAPGEKVEEHIHIHINSVREHKPYYFLDKLLPLKIHQVWTRCVYARINHLSKNGYYITP